MAEDSTNEFGQKSPECKLYRRRFFMLFIFVCFAVMNSFQWIQYSILANIVEAYYDVESVAVDWTSMIFMVAIVLLMIPSSHFLDRKGLRWTIVVGTFANAAGGCIKMASVGQDLFWVTFIGQTLAAVGTVFMVNVPPCLAAAWFGEKEVSTACSVGVFGNEMGIALGFYVPTLLVSNSENIDAIGKDLSNLFYVTAGVSSFIFLLALIFFQDKPPTPPSRQQEELIRADDDSLLATIRRLFKNRNYVLLVVVFCFNQAVFASLSTLLNQIVLSYFEGGEQFAGELGFILIVSGMIGGVIFGIILDKTYRYKETTLSTFILSLLGMAAFTASLEFQSEAAVYASVVILGIFLGGYMPIAYDFGAELTYPEPEGMTSGILTLPTQVFSIVATLIFGQMMTHVGTTWMNVTQCCCLLIGTIFHFMIRSDLRRRGNHCTS